MTRLVEALDRVIGWIAAAILLISFLLLVFSVFSRYVVVAVQVDWILEVVVFLIAWAVMLGVARIEKRAGHIRVDFVLEMFPERFKRVAEGLSLMFALAVGVFFAWAGVQVVQDAIMWGETTDSSLRIPFWWYYSTLTVSFTIHAIFILHRFRGVVTGQPLPGGHDLAD